MTEGTKLGDRIQALGYKVYEVADGSGVNRWTINDLLNRRCTPSPMHLVRLARFLECEPECLIE